MCVCVCMVAGFSSLTAVVMQASPGCGDSRNGFPRTMTPLRHDATLLLPAVATSRSPFNSTHGASTEADEKVALAAGRAQLPVIHGRRVDAG